ncbi:MAG: HlyC/CorC family transporter [Chitinophagaceae bacterium]|nr:HlyC/CorC family transporter [Chitinophagaceae bacterium]
MIADLILTIFLVVLNGFFVAAEFAIVKVRSSQIDVAKVSKSLTATAKNIVSNLDAYLAATQLGITLASLGLGWVGEDVMTHIIEDAFHVFNLSISPEAAHKAALPVAFFFITLLHIVFGELAPKSIAIRFPAGTTFAIAWPLRVFYFVFRPVIWLMNGLANFLLRIVGIKPLHGNEIHSEEELKMIITESHEGGAIEQTERELIQNVFDFDDRRVWDILTAKKNITAVPADFTVGQAMDFAIKEGYSRYPVCGTELDDIKGIIYTKDLMRSIMEDDANQEKSILPICRKAYFISASKKIKDLLKEFQKKRIHLAIVTDEVGDVTGIVSMEDILEELVGEIQDEYDNEKPVVESTNYGTFIVNAHHSLLDINKLLPNKFEENENYETLAGLIAYHHSEELKMLEKIALEHYEITILNTHNNSAEKVELKLIEEDEG